jgi:hypothetical protein
MRSSKKGFGSEKKANIRVGISFSTASITTGGHNPARGDSVPGQFLGNRRPGSCCRRSPNLRQGFGTDIGLGNLDISQNEREGGLVGLFFALKGGLVRQTDDPLPLE